MRAAPLRGRGGSRTVAPVAFSWGEPVHAVVVGDFGREAAIRFCSLLAAVERERVRAELATPFFDEYRRLSLHLVCDLTYLKAGQLAPYRLKLAVAYTGELELELIEWVSGDTPHREFLAKGRTGLHHLSFHVPDLDAVVAQAKGLGFEPIWYHAMSDEIKYTYLEREADPVLIELTQRPWSGGNVQRA